MVQEYCSHHEISEQSLLTDAHRLKELMSDNREQNEAAYLDGVEWKDAKERGEMARKMFKIELKFDTVHVFQDLSKKQVAE